MQPSAAGVMLDKFRWQIFKQLGGLGGKKKTRVEQAIGLLILFSILLAVLATEPVVRASQGGLLVKLDLAVAVIFLAEYLCRLWTSPLSEDSRSGLRGALDFARSPIALLDLVAIAPTFLGFVTPELYLLRIFRLARIGRVGRSKRFRKAFKHFNRALSTKKEELQISAIYSGVVITLSSILMFLVEGKAQAEQFGSIPRCLWWSVITVTTVGYGDTYPATALGKLIAALTAICGVAVIAIPIGIISAGFTESLGSERSSKGS